LFSDINFETNGVLMASVTDSSGFSNQF